MRAIAIIGGLFAVLLVTNVVREVAHDITHPPGPCSVLDYRRCASR